MKFLVQRLYDRIPHFSRYDPACMYRVYIVVDPSEHTTAQPMLLPKKGSVYVRTLADFGFKNAFVLERRIAEMAFPEVVNLPDYSYPNRLPSTFWRSVPQEYWKDAKVVVELDEIPPEWFEQDPKECTNTLVQDKARRLIRARYARGS